MNTNILLIYQYESLAVKGVGRKNSIYAEIYRIFTNLFRISEFEGPEISSKFFIHVEKLRIGMYFLEYRADRGGKRLRKFDFHGNKSYYYEFTPKTVPEFEFSYEELDFRRLFMFFFS